MIRPPVMKIAGRLQNRPITKEPAVHCTDNVSDQGTSASVSNLRSYRQPGYSSRVLKRSKCHSGKDEHAEGAVEVRPNWFWCWRYQGKAFAPGVPRYSEVQHMVRTTMGVKKLYTCFHQV
ncbi:hypothetical protein DTO006G1_3235 [Penicillium roqueforti]|nr:hypothetical protein CBS147337_4491 [Penicillium roqueforti]KAI2725372.1 hypothetical protein CBS147354_4949 [Penicillium roqueforti]KAI2761696.1 hypothetical protein DTO006G1_3235 [Penicillium roqueforti]KAI3107298.1 hypothetical protein CBS147333_6367 [Penicillium roqueforti]KAI3149377.1 hypothetical protein CBS147325_3389 [Penicillium roqueforti]